MDMSTARPKSDIHTHILYPWISISKAGLEIHVARSKSKYYNVSEKNIPDILAVTRESIVGFS